jgi:2-isopropylmalate synthase
LAVRSERHPGLDFSDIDGIRDTVEHCDQLPVHPRHPYVGDLVYTLFLGSHQDAIKKTLGARTEDDVWEVPYLPIDPKDLGRSYQAVIRVNSQSGKGGITYLLEQDYGIALPRRAQIDFSRAVQQVTDAEGGEMTATDIWAVFERTYLDSAGSVVAQDQDISIDGNRIGLSLSLTVAGEDVQVFGSGDDVPNAAVAARNTFVGSPVSVVDVTNHEGSDGSGTWVCCKETRDSIGAVRFGIGIGQNGDEAIVRAAVSAVNRACELNADPAKVANLA